MLGDQLSLQHLHGSVSRDGYELSLLSGLLSRNRGVDLLSRQALPTLVVVTAGEHILQSGRQLRVEPGSAVVLASPEAMQWEWKALGNHRHRLAVMRWNPAAFERMAKIANADLRGAEGPEVFPATPALLALVQTLASPPPHWACLSVWYQAKVMEAAALALYHSAHSESEKGSEIVHQKWIEHAKYILTKDLQNPPSLEMLAEEVGCGAFHLSRLFKEYAGKTIPEFLRHKRIGLAAQMLATTERAVSDVVLEVGYESFSAFTRAFVREFGMTPSEYRRTGGTTPSGRASAG